MKSLFCLAGLALVSFSANAAPCTAKLYLKAETALLEQDAPAVTQDLVSQLRERDLNCYEHTAVRKLGAAAHVELGEYQAAITLLEPLATDSSRPDSERAKIAYSIGKLYQAIGDNASAAPFLDLSENLGGQTNDQ